MAHSLPLNNQEDFKEFFDHCSNISGLDECNKDSKCKWEDGQCDKSDKEEGFTDKSDKEEGFAHNGDKSDKGETVMQEDEVSDKGVSDKTTGTGYQDVRNANYLRMVYLLHILLVFPLFTLFGCLNRHFHLLGYDVCWLLGLLVLVYHGFSLVKSELTSNWNWSLSDALDFNLKPDKRNAPRLRTVYLFHVLIVAPLLLYIGTHNKKKIDPRALGAVCSLGVLALFYNGYSYWRSETTGQWNWGY